MVHTASGVHDGSDVIALARAVGLAGIRPAPAEQMGTRPIAVRSRYHESAVPAAGKAPAHPSTAATIRLAVAARHGGPGSSALPKSRPGTLGASSRTAAKRPRGERPRFYGRFTIVGPAGEAAFEQWQKQNGRIPQGMHGPGIPLETNHTGTRRLVFEIASEQVALSLRQGALGSEQLRFDRVESFNVVVPPNRTVASMPDQAITALTR